MEESAQITPIERWITLAVLAVIVVGCYFVIQPFLSALVWAFILCCATWPVFVRVRTLVAGRAGVASRLCQVAVC